MRTVIAALMFTFACGARSEIAGDEIGADAGGLDATIDAHDASAQDGGAGDVASDALKDAMPDALCCDDGVKLSGCQTCAAGETCINKMGSCTQTVTNCGPSTCTGCCLGATLCADGITAGACGNHGQFCQTCIDTKTNKYSACIADDAGGGGTCLGGPTCTDANCHAGGCCSGDLCVLGDTNTLCGYGGTCVDCTQGGGTCKNQTCDYPHQ
jgi:hypothetical protein